MFRAALDRSTEGELVLTRDEAIAILDGEATRRYGLTAAQFISQIRNGDFGQYDDAIDLIGFARLLGAEDPLGLAS